MDVIFLDDTLNVAKSLEFTMAFLAAKGNDSYTRFTIYSEFF